MSWIKSSLIVLVVTIVTIKAVDYSFGSFRQGSSEGLTQGQRSILLREHNPNQSAVIIPSDDYMDNTDGLIQKEYRISIDANGFIENGNPKTDNSFVIAFIGGSTTETIHMEEKDRFPSVVERELREKLSRNIKTINAGVSGNNSMHSLLNFQSKILPENPKIAVLMHNINDFALLSKTGSYWIAPKGKEIVKGEGNTSEISNEISLFDLMKSAKNIFLPNLYAYLKPRLFPNLDVRDEFEGYRKGSIENYSIETRSMFEKSLRSFVELSRTWDVKPILMTQFNRVSTKDYLFMRWIRGQRFGNQAEEMAGLYNELNEIIRKVAAETDTQLIDLDIKIPKTSEYIYDIVHLNTKGSRLVGNLISQELIKAIEN
tara:strand:+ start:2641 stop:3759 length:1119 start_codon:yes stop_codon:yes gene_type:complete